jgi:hypothetical protein
MPNGSAALHLAFEPAPESKDASVGKPIETVIGEAMASAATGLCFAMQEFQNGGLTSTTRTENGARIAALYWLQQAHAGEIDFPAVARAAGKAVLQTYFDADFYRTYGEGAGEGVLDAAIDGVLEVVAKVTASEKAFAN